MAGFRRPVLMLVLLSALLQVQAVPWERWACEGAPAGGQSEPWSPTRPATMSICCKWTGDSDGTFTTDVRRCASHGISCPQTGTECAWCVSRGAARPRRLLPRV
jgi:hypothetical protein